MIYETIHPVVLLIGDVTIIGGLIISLIIFFKKVIDAIKCILRAEMLRIYYHNKDAKTIRQYEKEHFIKCYEAYKALKGNSFIDDIKKDVFEWEVIT